MTARRKRRRVVYLAPVHRDPPGDATGSAARNKVLGICAALATVGLRPVIVAVAPYDRDHHRPRRIGQTLFVETPAWARGPWRRASAVWGQTIAGLRVARRGDRVILYNFFPEYLLLALLLKLKGTPAILDVEDGPAATLWPFNRLLNRLFWHLTLPLVAPGKLIVADSLGRRLGIRHCLAVYGVHGRNDSREDLPRFSGAQVRINFGGTITDSTGLGLFRDTLTWLATHAPASPLAFVVTGRLPPDAREHLASVLAAAPGLSLEIRDNLSMVAYQTLLDRCDVGLSLRMPGSEIAETTFPSKVIEIAGAGLLLVTTRVSDIPAVFDANTAVILDDATPEALGKALVDIAMHRDEARRRAADGRRMIKHRFSPEACGRAIASFIRAKP